VLFTVWCHRRLSDALAAGVKAARKAELAWLEQARVDVGLRTPEGRAVAMKPSSRAALAREVRRRRQRAREVGQLRGTREAFLLPHLLHNMGEQGWLGQDWKPIPAGEVGPGRAWGTADQGYDARFVVTLPDDIGETLRRACYWTSAPHVTFLREWYDRHGDHWRGVLHSEHHWVGVGPTRAQLRARDEAAGEIITPPDALRWVAERAVEITS
jgi:hypothetical protein